MDKSQIAPFVYVTDTPTKFKKICSKLVHFTEAAIDMISELYAGDEDELLNGMRAYPGYLDENDNIVEFTPDLLGMLEEQLSQEEEEEFEDDEEYEVEEEDIEDELIIAKCVKYCREFIDDKADFVLNEELLEVSEEPVCIGILKKKRKANNG